MSFLRKAEKLGYRSLIDIGAERSSEQSGICYLDSRGKVC